MAKRAKLLNPRPKAPGVVEQQRLQKIAEARRAIKQERQLVALGRQLHRAIHRTMVARKWLIAQLAEECGYDLSERAQAVNE